MRAASVARTLGEVCDFRGGGTPSKKVARYWDGDIPWVSPKDVKSEVVTDSVDHISSEAIQNSATSLIPPGSILVVVRSGILARIVPLAIAGRELTINQDLKALVPKADVDGRYLYYFLQAKMHYLLSRVTTGATVHRIGTGDIRSLQIDVPSIAEQQRIVAILDEAFEGIATAKANAEKNLKSAKSLFDSYLESVFAERGKGWLNTTLGAEVDLLVGFAFKSAKYSDGEDDIFLLRGDNIVQGSLRWDDVKKWPKIDTAAYERYWLREGDVVLAMDRPWVKAGLKHATITADDLPCLLVQRTACLRCKPCLDSRFLLYLVRSAAFIRHILGVQTGIGVPHISGQQIKDFAYACPPVADQGRIAARLDALSVEIQNLESIFQQKIAALDDLKKSLLHHAFSGQL